jgi:DNA-binding transcriptional ArsR family regulator
LAAVKSNQPAKSIDTDQLALWCKALGHPARTRIVAHLKTVDSCICGEIVDMLPLSQSTVSQHLKVLKEAGFISGEVAGPRTCYCLETDVLEQFKQMLTLFLSD